MILSLKSKGFTLIEVLLAIVILSISLLALAALMVTTTQNSSFGGHVTEAATYAQDQLERLRITTSWGDIDNDWVDSTGIKSITTPSGITYSRTLNVLQTGTLKKVTITVNWTDPDAKSFSIISAIQDPNH